MSIDIRNPSGYCDHLYYPDYCEVCRKQYGLIFEERQARSYQYRKMYSDNI